MDHHCPYCAEEIRPGIRRCPHCRTVLERFDVDQWARDVPDARLGGVAAGLSRFLDVPVGLVRAGFVVLTFFHFFGPPLYAALWLAMPASRDEDSPVETFIDRARGVAQRAVREPEAPRQRG